MKFFTLLFILLLLITPLYCFAEDNKNWNEILEENLKSWPKFELNDFNNRKLLIAHFILNGKKKIVNYIEEYLSNQYDPVLMSLYLSMRLKNKNIKGLLPYLSNYYKKDKENCVPCYYLSYYYLCDNNLKLCVKYLNEGNEKKYLSLYSITKKEIIFDYLYANTKNEIISYSSIFRVPDADFLFILRKLSKNLKDLSNDSIVSAEILRLGEKIESNGTFLVEKIMGIGIQIDGVSKEKNVESYSKLIEKHKYLRKLNNKIENRKGKEALLAYLKMAYIHGETYALEHLTSKKEKKVKRGRVGFRDAPWFRDAP